MTRLSCLNIALGKLVSSLSFMAMMLLCSLPVLAMTLLLGGVSPAQIAWALGAILATMILFGAIGMYCSARFARTSVAVTLAYIGSLGWLFFIPLWLYLSYAISGRYYDYGHRGGQGLVSYIINRRAALALIPAGFFSLLLAIPFSPSDGVRLGTCSSGARAVRRCSGYKWFSTTTSAVCSMTRPAVRGSSSGNPVFGVTLIIAEVHGDLSGMPGSLIWLFNPITIARHAPLRRAPRAPDGVDPQADARPARADRAEAAALTAPFHPPPSSCARAVMGTRTPA